MERYLLNDGVVVGRDGLALLEGAVLAAALLPPLFLLFPLPLFLIFFIFLLLLFFAVLLTGYS